jgi:hypothetical protein
MAADGHDELRPAYRTLDDPVRYLGLSLGAWVAIALAAGIGYGWLVLSPLGWRASVSVAVIVLGAPACLLALREPSTVGPARLLAGVLGWRARPARIHAPDLGTAARRGAIRLDAPRATPVGGESRRGRPRGRASA